MRWLPCQQLNDWEMNEFHWWMFALGVLWQTVFVETKDGVLSKQRTKVDFFLCFDKKNPLFRQHGLYHLNKNPLFRQIFVLCFDNLHVETKEKKLQCR